MSQRPPHRRPEQGDDRRQQPRQQPAQHTPQRRQRSQQQSQPVQQQPRQQPPRRQSHQQPRQQQPQHRPRQRQQSQYRQQSRAGGVQKVEQGDEYVHVRFRNPEDFATIRTPDWAAHAAQDIAPGAEVRTGKLKGSGEWQTESVLIPAPVDGQTAARLATRIVQRIGE